MRRPRDEESFKEYSYVLRYRKAEEIIAKVGKNAGNLGRVALVFPNSYNIASGSLAWSWIQTLLFRRGLNVQRFFYEKWFRRFYSMEEQIPIDEFPVWLFTFQFENDLLNIADILRKKGIPIAAHERANYHPIVIIGGPVTLFNHSIVEEIADFVFIGDIECSIEDFASVLMQSDKENISTELLKINQIYSSKYGKRNFSNCIGQLQPVPVSHYTTLHSPYKNKVLIEIGRGCIRRCAFCVTGYTKKPVKFAKVDDVIEILEENKDKEFGFISATITDYPYLDKLLDYLESKNIRFSVSSMRADGLNERLLRLLKETDHHSFTIAPEGISQKMREIMLKDLSTEQIIRGLELGNRVGFQHVKLYYIIGLEEEDTSDYEEFFDFLKMVANMGYKEITVSINPLVPKLSTPFSNRRMIEKKEYEERIVFIRKNVPKHVKTNFESYKESRIQYEISNLIAKETLEYINEKLR